MRRKAERAIRWAKVKDKVSGCFRFKSGAGQFAAVLSCVSAAALHGLSSFDAHQAVLLAKPFNSLQIGTTEQLLFVVFFANYCSVFRVIRFFPG